MLTSKLGKTFVTIFQTTCGMSTPSDRAMKILEDSAVETASIQTKPALPRVEELTVKITLFSSVRGGGLRFCRRGFNRRLRFCRRGFNRRIRFCRRGFNRRLILHKSLDRFSKCSIADRDFLTAFFPPNPHNGEINPLSPPAFPINEKA